MSTNARVVPVEEWYVAYRKAFEASEYKGFLTDFTFEELKKRNALICWLTPDRKTGVAAYPENGNVYAIGLFNVGGIPGAGYNLFESVVYDRKVTDLDCFDGPLVDMYRSLGFETVEKVPFDPQYAHDWNYDRDGQPDVHFMRKEWD